MHAPYDVDAVIVGPSGCGEVVEGTAIAGKRDSPEDSVKRLQRSVGQDSSLRLEERF